MSFINTKIIYPLLIILSIKKRSFAALGEQIDRSGDTVKRRLISADDSKNISHMLAQYLFKGCKSLIMSVDDTLLAKIHSMFMVGAGKNFDTKTNRCIMSYRLIVGALTDGKIIAPIDFGFIFTKELLSENDLVKTKLDFIKQFLAVAKKLFPDAKIKIAADGLFASVDTLKWCLDANTPAVMRMHNNRVVTFKNKSCKISEITCIKPRGRQIARAIKIIWHDLELYLAAERRIDKHGIESVVYLVATYQVRPIQYVRDYKKRWPIEKFFRTSKQHLGIAECFSTQLETQEKHIAAVLLAYAMVQLEMKKQKLDTPEAAIRALKHYDPQSLTQRFMRFDQIFGGVHA